MTLIALGKFLSSHQLKCCGHPAPGRQKGLSGVGWGSDAAGVGGRGREPEQLFFSFWLQHQPLGWNNILNGHWSHLTDVTMHWTHWTELNLFHERYMYCTCAYIYDDWQQWKMQLLVENSMINSFIVSDLAVPSSCLRRINIIYQLRATLEELLLEL